MVIEELEGQIFNIDKKLSYYFLSTINGLLPKSPDNGQLLKLSIWTERPQSQEIAGRFMSNQERLT